MATYRIDPRNNADKGALMIEAESHADAAHKAAKKWFGPQVWANRETGDTNGSGVFQAFVTISTGEQSSSRGRNFHVMEL